MGVETGMRRPQLKIRSQIQRHIHGSLLAEQSR